MNPKPFLLELTGKQVAVKLKWGMEYRGTSPDRQADRQRSQHTDVRMLGQRLTLSLARWRSLCPPGFLVSVDSYMNLQLASSEEWIGGKLAGNLGEVLIRCNNVLYIRGVPEEEQMGDGSKDATMGV